MASAADIPPMQGIMVRRKETSNSQVPACERILSNIEHSGGNENMVYYDGNAVWRWEIAVIAYH